MEASALRPLALVTGASPEASAKPKRTGHAER